MGVRGRVLADTVEPSFKCVWEPFESMLVRGEGVEEAVDGEEAVECQDWHRGADLMTDEGRVAAQERAAHMSTTKETTPTPRRAPTKAINELRYKLQAFVCRPHWSEADKQKAFGFTTKCAHVYYGTLPLE